MEKSEDVAAAGLLHDLGKLILLSQLRDDYEKVVTVAREKRIHIRNAELEVLGVSHDVVGHWLMKRWRIQIELQSLSSIIIEWMRRISLSMKPTQFTWVTH